MNARKRDSVVQWYDELEEELRRILFELPPVPSNLRRSSPRLASIAVEACSMIDSLFRQASPDPSTVGGKSIKRKDLDIRHFAVLFAASLRLAQLKSILLIAEPKYVSPFSKWRRMTSQSEPIPLTWWQAHQKLKHDRIQEWERGTLSLAIDCLCALHQVISRLPVMAEALVRFEWVWLSGWNPELVVEALRGTNALGGDPLSSETRLFVTPLGPRSVPTNVTDFKPALYGCSRRVAAFFGRWV
jgi:hypothetical protein